MLLQASRCCWYSAYNLACVCRGAVSAWLLRALGATWRLRQLGQDPRTGRVDDPPQLAALFHESLIGAAHGFRDRGYGVAVSRSRDGDLVAATLARLGYADLPRGSSSKDTPCPTGKFR